MFANCSANELSTINSHVMIIGLSLSPAEEHKEIFKAVQGAQTEV